MRALINRLFRPSKSTAQPDRTRVSPSGERGGDKSGPAEHAGKKTNSSKQASTELSPGQLAENLHSASPSEQVTVLLEQLDNPAVDKASMTALVEVASSICEQALAEVAFRSRLGRVRRAAAEALTSSACLETAAAGLRQKDKGAYAVVRQRLEGRRLAERKLTDASQLWREIEADLDLLMASDQWHRLDDRMHSFTSRIGSAREASEFGGETPAQLSAMAATVDEKLATAAKTIEALDRDAELKTVIEDLGEVVEELKEAPLRHDQLPALAAIITTQTNRWSNACEMAGYDRVPQALQKQSDKLFQALRNLEAELGTAVDAELAIIVDESGQNADELDEVAAAKVEEDAQRKALRDEEIKVLDTLLAGAGPDLQQGLVACEAALDEGQVGAATKLLAGFDAGFKKFQSQATEIRSSGFKQHRNGADYLQSLQNSRQLCSGRLHELRNWQEFAAAPKRQQLLDSAEQLAGQNIEPRKKSERMKSLRAEWQQLGHGNDRRLNAAFETAMKQIQASCSLYFEEEKRLRELNQARRSEILSALQKLANSDELESIDSQALQTIVERSKQEWREAFPVDRRVQASGQREFERLLIQVEQPLELSRQQGEAGRQGLIDDLRSTLKQYQDGSVQLSALVEQAKSAQHAWKALPRTWHKADRALWQSFRATCDSIFQLRDGEKASQDEAIETLSAKLKTEVDQLNTMMANILAGVAASDGDSSSAVTAAASAFERTMTDEINKLRTQGHANSRPVSARLDRLQTSQRDALASIRKQLKQIAIEEAGRQRDAAFDRLITAIDRIGDLEAPQNSDRHWLQSAASEIGLDGADIVNPADIAARAAVWLDSAASSTDELIAGIKESIVRAEIAAGAATPIEDKNLRMSLQMQRLAEAGQFGGNRIDKALPHSSASEGQVMSAPLLQALIDAMGALLALHLASPTGTEAQIVAEPAESRRLANELIRRWRALTDGEK